MTGRELRQGVRTILQNKLIHLVGIYTRNDAPPTVRQQIEDTLAMTNFVYRVADDDEMYSGLYNVPIGRTETVLKMAMDIIDTGASKDQILSAMTTAIGKNVPRTEPEIMEQIRREGRMPFKTPETFENAQQDKPPGHRYPPGIGIKPNGGGPLLTPRAGLDGDKPPLATHFDDVKRNAGLSPDLQAMAASGALVKGGRLMASQGYRYAVMWVARRLDEMGDPATRRWVIKFVADIFGKQELEVVRDIEKFQAEMEPSVLP